MMESSHPCKNKSTIAAGCACADHAGIDADDIDAVLEQFVDGVQSRSTQADDTDIAGYIVTK
jgi:hypothetical protein